MKLFFNDRVGAPERRVCIVLSARGSVLLATLSVDIYSGSSGTRLVEGAVRRAIRVCTQDVKRHDVEQASVFIGLSS